MSVIVIGDVPFSDEYDSVAIGVQASQLVGAEFDKDPLISKLPVKLVKYACIECVPLFPLPSLLVDIGPEV